MHGGRECRGEHEKMWRETHRTGGGDVEEEGQKEQERQRGELAVAKMVINRVPLKMC